MSVLMVSLALTLYRNSRSTPKHLWALTLTPLNTHTHTRTPPEQQTRKDTHTLGYRPTRKTEHPHRTTPHKPPHTHNYKNTKNTSTQTTQTHRQHKHTNTNTHTHHTQTDTTPTKSRHHVTETPSPDTVFRATQSTTRTWFKARLFAVMLVYSGKSNTTLRVVVFTGAKASTYPRIHSGTDSMMTWHLAILRVSELLPPFTRAFLNQVTLTLGARWNENWACLSLQIHVGWNCT